MDCFRAGCLRGFKDAADIEITLRSRRRPDEHRFARLRDMHRMPVGFRINGNRPDAEPVQSPDNAARDGTAIGDQNF